MTTETNTPLPTKRTRKAPAKGKAIDANERAQNADGSLRKRGMTRRTERAVDTLKQQQSKAPKAKATGNTFTSVDLANEHGINTKTLRARIRRNIDKWQPLFKDGEKHVFADNATTRKAIAALLAD